VTSVRLNDAVPAYHDRLVSIAARVIVPSLTIGTSLAQERIPALPLVQAIGQILLWIGILAAIELVIVVHGNGRLVAILLVALFSTRAATVVLGGGGPIVWAYTVSLGLLLAAAAAALARHDPRLLHRQLLWLIGLSAPLMVLQIFGYPEIVHALRTDIHDPVFGWVVLPTLFNTDPNTGWSTIQGRPAGLMYANNFFSLIALFAIAVHLAAGRESDKKWDWIIGLVAALAMAKIVFLGLIVLTGVTVVVDREQRRRILRIWLALMVSMAGYYLVFRGLFLFNLSFTNILVNVTVRFQDIRAALLGADIADVVVNTLEGGVWTYTIEAGTQSGYATVAKYLPMIAVAFPIVAWFYVRRLSTLAIRDPLAASISRNASVAMLLAPVITAFFSAPFFAFAAGLASTPFWTMRERGVTLGEPLRGVRQLRDIFARRRRLVLAGATFMVLASLAMSLLGAPTYTSRALLVPEQSGPDRAQASRVAAQLGVSDPTLGAEGSPEFYEMLLRSNDVMREIANVRLAIQTDSGTRVQPLPHLVGLRGDSSEFRTHETVKLLREVLFISGSSRTNTITLRMRTRNPQVSKGVIDSLIAVFARHGVTNRRERSDIEARFIDNRLTAATAERDKAENDLFLFRLRNRFVASPSQQLAISRLERRIEQADERVGVLHQELQRQRVEAGRSLPAFSIAERPHAALRPDTKPILASAFQATSFFLLLVLAFGVARERLQYARAINDPGVAALIAELGRATGRFRRTRRGRIRPAPAS
jgi:hypothetical protein